MNWNKVVNNRGDLESCITLMNRVYTERTEGKKEGEREVFHFYLKPFKDSKTYLQLKSIRQLCNDLSRTQQEDWAGHSADWWYRYYKIRAYIPLLKIEALENRDDNLVALIQTASDFIKKSREGEFFGNQHDYSMEDLIADNAAFSYSKASKEHLISVIDYMLNDAPKKGVYLELKREEVK